MPSLEGEDASAPASPAAGEQKVTLVDLARWRASGRRAVFLTAYDYPTAVFADRAGVDLLLVGDSAAMTVLGLANTLGVGMAEMLVLARAVARGAKRALVVADMPFLSYQVSQEAAIRNAGAFVGQAGCDAVKCEGGGAVVPRVRAMTRAGLAVMGHLGLTPQRLTQLGGYRVQGRSASEARRLADEARRLQDAGVFAILVEAVPPETAAVIREALEVPVYGIGAGPHVDGQLLICHDLLGTFVGEIAPRFVKRYADLGAAMERAFRAYAQEVREGTFPSPEHCYPMPPEEAALLARSHIPGPSSTRIPSSRSAR